jgi:hypothetical protein
VPLSLSSSLPSLRHWGIHPHPVCIFNIQSYTHLIQPSRRCDVVCTFSSTTSPPHGVALDHYHFQPSVLISVPLTLKLRSATGVVLFTLLFIQLTLYCLVSQHAVKRLCVPLDFLPHSYVHLLLHYDSPMPHSLLSTTYFASTRPFIPFPSRHFSGLPSLFCSLDLLAFLSPLLDTPRLALVLTKCLRPESKEIYLITIRHGPRAAALLEIRTNWYVFKSARHSESECLKRGRIRRLCNHPVYVVSNNLLFLVTASSVRST